MLKVGAWREAQGVYMTKRLFEREGVYETPDVFFIPDGCAGSSCSLFMQTSGSVVLMFDSTPNGNVGLILFLSQKIEMSDFRRVSMQNSVSKTKH